MDTAQTILITTIGMLFIFFYFGFTAFSIYKSVTVKLKEQVTVVAKIVYYHGLSWIIGMIAICVFACALALARYLMFAMYGIK
jgi:hypothetical protein